MPTNRKQSTGSVPSTIPLSVAGTGTNIELALGELKVVMASTINGKNLELKDEHGLVTRAGRAFVRHAKSLTSFTDGQLAGVFNINGSAIPKIVNNYYYSKFDDLNADHTFLDSEMFEWHMPAIDNWHATHFPSSTGNQISSTVTRGRSRRQTRNRGPHSHSVVPDAGSVLAVNSDRKKKRRRSIAIDTPLVSAEEPKRKRHRRTTGDDNNKRLTISDPPPTPPMHQPHADSTDTMPKEGGSQKADRRQQRAVLKAFFDEIGYRPAKAKDLVEEGFRPQDLKAMRGCPKEEIQEFLQLFTSLTSNPATITIFIQKLGKASEAAWGLLDA